MLDAIVSVLLELAPWLLLGAAIAGVLHGLLPADFVRRHLGGRGGVAKAVALGVPLPLCSCGVIPAGLGLEKDGASKGASVGFLISTPQTGVDSILVSASFLGWPFALFKVASAAVMGWVGGSLTDAGSRPRAPASAVAPASTAGPDSLRAMAEHALDVLRTIWRWLVVGILASAAITTFVPTPVLAGVADHGELFALGATLALSLPLYVCATASVPIAATLVAGGFPPGAALVFLMAGPATNLATIGAVYRAFGRRTLGIYLSTIVVGSIGLGWAFDTLLATRGVVAAHVHGEPTWWAVLSAVVLSALLAAFAIGDLRSAWSRLRSTRTPETGTVSVDVRGMTCEGCVRKLDRMLRSDQRVDAARVTLEPGHAEVQGDVDEARVRSLVEAAGFTVG